MVRIIEGFRHSPKQPGNSAPSPFSDWGQATIDTGKGGGYDGQQQENYIWSGSTDRSTKVKWGDTNVSYSDITGFGKSGKINVKDHYGSSNSSHNVLWCVEWAPYSFSVGGISFDYVYNHSGAGDTGWGFGKMFLFYRYNGTGSSIVREITPISGCKTGNGQTLKFHRSNTSTWGEVTNYQRHSYATRAHLIAATTDIPSENYLCVGWGGFYSLDNTNSAALGANHGFTYDNFYLLPSGDVSTSSKWIGGVAAAENRSDNRRIYTA